MGKWTRAATGTEAKSFDPKRLARLHDAMRRHVDSGAVPGLVLLVNHCGREHVDAIGSMSHDGVKPIQRDTIFRIASMTKPITAVATMTLIEECRVRLDDPVDEWLPELKDRRVLRTVNSPLEDTVPAKRPITARDLLTFRSGYGEVGFVSVDSTLEKALLSPTCPLQKAMIEAQLPLSAWRFLGTSTDFMKRVGSLPLAFQPGERWLYHMSAEILGILIARVSGKPLGTFLRERIFEPLGMQDTAFWVPEAKLERLPTCYGVDMITGRRVVLDEAKGDWARPPVFEAGGGGLVSTVDDLAAFGRMMLNHGRLGEQRILSRPSVEAMTTDQLTPEQKALSPFFENFWDDHGWGLGIGLITKRTEPAAVPGRFGWDGAFGSSWWVDPQEQIVGVLMVQRRPDVLGIPPTIRDFWTSIYQLIDS